MTDEYATERAAARAGATIQAYTLYEIYEIQGNQPIDHGLIPMHRLPIGSGYWRDLDGEPQFSCHPSRYRVKP